MRIQDGVIEYALEDKLVQKLDLMIERVMRPNQKQNAYLQNHGLPGEGKTNSSLAEAHYIKLKTKRQIHLYFRLEGLINFLKNSDSQLAIWDEPSLDSLSTDQLARINRDLLRLVNTGRKKRHFVIVNFTKFWKFSEDMVVDTCLGMIHHNSKNGTNPGRFLYIRQKNLEKLWNDYHKSKKRNYGKYKSFGGRMPHVMEKYFDLFDVTIEGKPHCTYDDYERLKDASIASIGETQKVSKKEQVWIDKLTELRYNISQVPKQSSLTQLELAAILKINPARLREWAKSNVKVQNSLETDDSKASASPIIITTMAESDEILSAQSSEEEGLIN